MNRLLPAALSLIACAASGCAAQVPAGPESPGAEPGTVVIVAASHANAPVPELRGNTRTMVFDTLLAGGTVRVLTADRSPSEVSMRLKPVKGTPAGRARIAENNLKLIEKALQAPPDTDGADTSEGVRQAAGMARSLGKPNATVVVIGPLLDDNGDLDLTGPGMLEADPGEVVRALAARPNGLPDLKDLNVVLAGAGYATEPQELLSGPQRDQVIAIWSSWLTASGARVRIDPYPVAGPSVATSYTVRPVPLTRKAPEPAPAAAPPRCQRTELVFPGNSTLKFVADRDVFANPDAARTALIELAGWLAADPARKAMVRGTTFDDGSPLAGQKELASRRARRVVDTLVSLGARPEQLTAVGVGPEFPERVVPDRTAEGIPLPGPAAMNRSTRVTTTDAC